MKKKGPRRSSRPRFLPGPKHRLIIVFCLFVLLPGSFLGVYSLRALRQEDRLTGQRIQERLEKIISDIGQSLDSAFQIWQDIPGQAAGDKAFESRSCPDIIRRALGKPGGGVIVTRTTEEIKTYPQSGLLYSLANIPANPIESPMWR